MTATLRVDGRRDGSTRGVAPPVDREATGATIAVEAPPAPHHVPLELTAEHPDAARIVAERAKRRAAVRVVSRGDRRRSRARVVLGLAACAALGAFTSGSRTATDALAPAAPVVLSEAGGARTDAASCGAVRSVVLRCTPSCPPVSASMTFGCGPALQQ